MWKIAWIYIVICLVLFCSPLKGKEVLDEMEKNNQKAKGRELISYEVDHVDKKDSLQSIFYIRATVKTNSTISQVNDTINVNTTMDGILVNPAK
ncbi:MAG TPA: hypothetical protein VK787_13480 [Puia sp.]|jgi:hypothetical protein|nr:hypothetical protein [Puia sp.]